MYTGSHKLATVYQNSETLLYYLSSFIL